MLKLWLALFCPTRYSLCYATRHDEVCANQPTFMGHIKFLFKLAAKYLSIVLADKAVEVQSRYRRFLYSNPKGTKALKKTSVARLVEARQRCTVCKKIHEGQNNASPYGKIFVLIGPPEGHGFATPLAGSKC